MCVQFLLSLSSYFDNIVILLMYLTENVNTSVNLSCSSLNCGILCSCYPCSQTGTVISFPHNIMYHMRVSFAWYFPTHSPTSQTSLQYKLMASLWFSEHCALLTVRCFICVNSLWDNWEDPVSSFRLWPCLLLQAQCHIQVVP
jgi:hypothetical protein